MNTATWMSLLFLSLIWGGSFFFFKVLLFELPPLTIVALRLVVSAAAFSLVLLAIGQRWPRAPEIWRSFFVMGTLNNFVPFTLIVWSEIHITSGLASILNAMTTVFSVLVAGWARHERLTANRLGGALVALAGVAILIGPDALHGLNFKSLAQLAVLLASLLYACASTYGRRFAHLGVNPILVAAGQSTAGAIICVPLELLVDRPWHFAHAPSLDAWLAVLGLSLLSTVVAYIIFFRILATAGATNALLVSFLMPISTLVLGALFLGERLSLIAAAGMAVIFLGIALLDGRLLLWLRQGLGGAARIRDA